MLHLFSRLAMKSFLNHCLSVWLSFLLSLSLSLSLSHSFFPFLSHSLFVISCWSIPLRNGCLPLTYSNHGVLGKGFFQSTFDIGIHYLCSGSERASLALLTSHSHSPTGKLTGESNSERVNEASPQVPLPRYNPSKWNQSGTKHPAAASKRSSIFC